MATIDIKIEDNLLVVTVTGELTANETMAVIHDHYPTGIIKDVIWDLTNGSLLSISQDGFRAIAHAAKQAVASGSRQGGKTAYVGLATVEYGLLRMYSSIAEVTGVPIKYYVYRTIEEARNWIYENQSEND